ncbi:hypothetical protein CROQUDRAFT_82802 [Cronartium quercuum f. sp. fusiforme G11]|uniref:Prefoldin subunit 6 n=1 Tax=Cronartium quercuum f. sp. fusiforme G11 TaxID=708437 RepID=A0A9P6T7W2_9BASI|nr:hypothetical protein CROQUDRAFT_82802 [Cronartium quercuum f. sp. fusiforme G11]
MTVNVDLKAASTAYQNAQAELSKLVTSRQKFESQLTENLAVKTEFDQLPESTDDSSPSEARYVYKLIANVLIKQDTAEAKTNVNRRIEFLKAEQSKVDEKISALQKQMETQKMELIHLQSQLQQHQATAQSRPDVPITGPPKVALSS